MIAIDGILIAAPLLAAPADWGLLIKVIVVVVIILVSALNKLMSAQKGKPMQPKRPVKRPPLAPPPKAEGKAAGRQELATEIEEFLRRAAQKRSGQPPKTEPTRQPQPARLSPRGPALSERTHEAGQDPEPIAAVEVHESVADHVRKHIENPEFSRRAEHIGDDMVRGDQQMEDHLKKAFTHQVGRLTDTSGPGGTSSQQDDQPVLAPVVAGVSVAALLKSGQNVRSAIILNEILQRPADRW